jgi:hypothetical protein
MLFGSLGCLFPKGSVVIMKSTGLACLCLGFRRWGAQSVKLETHTLDDGQVAKLNGCVVRMLFVKHLCWFGSFGISCLLAYSYFEMPCKGVLFHTRPSALRCQLANMDFQCFCKCRRLQVERVRSATSDSSSVSGNPHRQDIGSQSSHSARSAAHTRSTDWHLP